MKRADLLLQDTDGETIGAVEVKLGHRLGQEQSDWYLETFDADLPLLLATLDPDDAGTRARTLGGSRRPSLVSFGVGRRPRIPRWQCSPPRQQTYSSRGRR